MSYVLAFLGFAMLIILHEAGHFAAAKAVGMRVERFSLFFGPLLVKFRRGETVYGIGPIPLGGYVKITGMNPAEDIPPEALPRAYYNQKVWKRVVVILAGPGVNLLLAFLIIWALFLTHDLGNVTVTQKVGGVLKGTPAAGLLLPGDRIVSVDGVSGSPTAIRGAIARHTCSGQPVQGCLAATPATIVVRRHGTPRSFQVRPRYDVKAGRPLLGFDFAEIQRPVSAMRGAELSVTALWSVTTRTVSAIARILEPKERAQLHSVVGTYKATQQEFAKDTTLALETLALISLSLAIINLFPFLPLDGGHVFWAV